ncbi:hypothetical protein F5Y15DRAFT_224244 [Xylariaceae sp. FL0016]|nr:hypothetical protein F5Y15DRAFT_224244 [Xylariaceae sp. FL0016]
MPRARSTASSDPSAAAVTATPTRSSARLRNRKSLAATAAANAAETSPAPETQSESEKPRTRGRKTRPPQFLDGASDPAPVVKGARAEANAEEAESVGQSMQSNDESERGLAMPMSWSARNKWVVFAIASGACAAFNGVFAKLTTNDLTTHISQAISNVLGLSNIEGFLEIVVRCIFFGLNLVFNGIMWTLFTQALAKGHSTTQVSIMNTSANFMLTALLGLVIFAESLPPLWWVGAAMLVVGNVIIGRKDEGTKDGENASEDDREEALPLASAEEGLGDGELGRAEYSPLPQARLGGDLLGEEKEDEDVDEDVALLGDLDDREGR